jgi:hypothetical protein
VILCHCRAESDRAVRTALIESLGEAKYLSQQLHP